MARVPLTAPVEGEEVFQHLDMAGHLLTASFHQKVGLLAPGQRIAVRDPEVLADEHVAAMLLPAHCVFSPPHLRDQQKG